MFIASKDLSVTHTQVIDANVMPQPPSRRSDLSAWFWKDLKEILMSEFPRDCPQLRFFYMVHILQHLLHLGKHPCHPHVGYLGGILPT